MSTVPSYTLNNGVSMPAIGLGCWSGVTKEEQEAGTAWMLTALQQGYKHFDTAYTYFTETSLAKAITESGVPREQLFITTKLGWHHPGHVEESFNESLRRLNVDYVDLYLMHWPHAAVFKDLENAENDEHGDIATTDTPTLNETWADLEKILASGKAKAIGVSNFSVKTLEQLFQTAKVVPAVNQVELHPYLVQDDLKTYCDSKGILLTAYSPSGYAPVRNDPVINELAKKYNATPTQVSLAWHLARGHSAVPKSTSAEHQKENINLPTLDPEDVQRITALDQKRRLCNYANERGKVWGWTYEQLGW